MIYTEKERAIADAEIEIPVSGKVVPADKDWHTIITRKQVMKEKPEPHYVTTFKIETGIYKDGGWSLGSADKRPLDVVMYDATVRIKNTRGPLTDTGVARLLEAIGESWRAEYISALAIRDCEEVIYLERTIPIGGSKAKRAIRKIKEKEIIKPMLTEAIDEIKESLRIQSKNYDQNTKDRKYHRRAFNQGAMYAYKEVLELLQGDEDIQRILEDEA